MEIAVTEKAKAMEMLNDTQSWFPEDFGETDPPPGRLRPETGEKTRLTHTGSDGELMGIR